MSDKKALPILSKESEKVLLDYLPTKHRLSPDAINAFYFLYVIGVMFDDVKNGAELYSYIESKCFHFLCNADSKVLEYLKKMDRESPEYRLGKLLIITSTSVDLPFIFFAGEHKDELIKMFDEELFSRF